MANNKPIGNYVKIYISAGSTRGGLRAYCNIQLDNWSADRCDLAFNGQVLIVRRGMEISCKGKQFKGRGGVINQVAFPSPIMERHPSWSCGYRVEGNAVIIRAPDWWPADARRGYVGNVVVPDPIAADAAPAPRVAPVLPVMKPLVPGTPEWRDRVVRVTFYTAKAAAQAEGFQMNDWRDLQRYNEARRARGDAQFAIVLPNRHAA